MTPTELAATALGTVAAIALGVLVGDLLVDDPAPGAAPGRTAIETADPGGPAPQQPELSVVSIGATADATGGAGDDPGAGDEPGEGSADVGTGGAAEIPAAALASEAIDVDGFAAFDEAAETGGDLPDLPGGPAVEDPDEAFAPMGGDEGTVDEPREVPTPFGPADRERPDSVPALDPDVWDVEAPLVVGFDDPCSAASLAGCPFGIPATVLGEQPTVPLRLGSVAVLGTETFHGGVCDRTWSLQATRVAGTPEPTALAITTNQDVDIEVDFGDGDVVRTGPEDPDLALAAYVADARPDGRVPSEGPGAVVTCLLAPAAEDGLLRGKVTATAGEQVDTLGFELRLAGPGRSRPISFLGLESVPVPAGSSGFELAVPQHDPAQELVVVGLVQHDGPRHGRADCGVFDEQLAAARTGSVGGRGPDDGQPALPVGLTLTDGETRLSPRGTVPVSTGVRQGYNATFRGHAPEGAELLLCAWWFDLEPDGASHRVTTGAPNDTAVLRVRVPRDMAPGVWVTGITLPDERPAGHYNLYLVKPGVAAICLPRNRPDPFPTAPVGAAAGAYLAEIAEGGASTAPDDGASTPADEPAADAEDEPAAEAEAAARSEAATRAGRIPAGRYDFGPREPQDAVRICMPRALANFAVPMVKSGSRPYLPGGPPIPLGANLPLVPDRLEPPELSKTYPVVARDGAVLRLTVVPASTLANGRTWPTGVEEPQPPATVRSRVDVVGEPDIAAGSEPGTAVVSVRFNENVDVRITLRDSADDASPPCTTTGGTTEAVSPNGPDHVVTFTGLCAGTAYGVTIEATDADGTTTTFVGGTYRVPPNAGFFDIDVAVTAAPEGGAALRVADVQFLRQPGVVSLSSRLRADALLGDCLDVGDVDDGGTVLTSFGELARIRVRVEGTAGCGEGTDLRIDNTLELDADDLAAGPLVFDVSHPTGLTLRITITPRVVR